MSDWYYIDFSDWYESVYINDYEIADSIFEESITVANDEPVLDTEIPS